MRKGGRGCGLGSTLFGTGPTSADFEGFWTVIVTESS